MGVNPIRRVLRPDHCEEDRATRNLAERRKGRKSGRSRGRREGKRRTLEKYRVSDSREEGE
jgi:predicted transposase YdaD